MTQEGISKGLVVGAGKGVVRLTGAQLRAARGLVDMSAAELAEASGVGHRTIKRAEQDDGPVQLMDANIERLIGALEARGVIFITANGDGPGVRLGGQSAKRSTAKNQSGKPKRRR
jgi:transcriptional regulator with XRE-family HTH domain